MEVAMSALKQRLARLRGFNAAVRQGDPKIAEESADLNGLETLEVERPPEVLEQDIGLESIAMRTAASGSSDPGQRHPTGLHRRGRQRNLGRAADQGQVPARRRHPRQWAASIWWARSSIGSAPAGSSLRISS